MIWQFIQDNIIAQVIAYILPIIVTAAIGWAAVLYTRLTGKELEAKHRDALQSALSNGLNWAIQQILDGKLNADGTVPASAKTAVLAKAQEYVVTSVPDAVRTFKITPQTMDKLIEAKLPVSSPKSMLEE